MVANILKKSLILIAIYAVVIIGIFVLQFKNDSIISEKLGSLHITLLESIAEDNSVGLKNKFSAVFNGLSFSADDDSPAVAKIRGTEKPITLISWEKTSPLTCTFKFSDDISVNMILTDDTNRSTFALKANLPKNVEYLKLPYGLSGGASISFQNDRKVQIDYSQASWELNAVNIGANNLVLTKANPGATYTFFDDSKDFSFAVASSMPGATLDAYRSTKSKISGSLIKAFASAVSKNSAISEQEAVSYVSAMAEKGNYSAALDAIPASMKKNPSGSYIATTFLGNLVNSNKSLEKQLLNCENSIKSCAVSGSLEAFGLAGITDYMMIHPGSSTVQSYLKKVADGSFSNGSVIQASNVLAAYNKLFETNKVLAAMLAPAANKCVAKIESACSLDGKNIIISDNGSLLSVIQAVRAGDAVMQYGIIRNNAEYMAGGELIINSYAGNCDSFELGTLSDLYAITVHDNHYYPHAKVIGYDNGKAVWVWTSAESVSFEKDSLGNIALGIAFQQSYTHYLMVSGIKSFNKIFIYDMAFRTDPRFETYNSSGYVHQKDNDVLLLKSRHRSANEVIRLVYNTAAVEKPAMDAASAAAMPDAASAGTAESESAPKTEASGE